jgi:cell division septation protein DedD
MEVTCPQCRTEQQLSADEAALFWAVCSECGVIHGPATAKAAEGLPLPADITPFGNQHDDATEWVPAHEMFGDILTFVDEETGDGSPDAQQSIPEDLFGTIEAASAEPPDQLTLEASCETNGDSEEGSPCPTDNVMGAAHLSQPPEGRSESDVEGPPPVSFGQFASAPDGYAVGLRVLRVAPVWLLSALGFLCVITLLSWASKPDGVAAPTSSGGRKTEATNRSPSRAPSALTNPINSAPKTVETAPAEERAAEARTVKGAETVSAAPPAQEANEGGGNFTAQVGSYRDVSAANERVSALRAAGFEASAVEAEIPGRGVWHRVQCGRFGTREEAARFGVKLRAKGFAREVIIAEVQKR